MQEVGGSIPPGSTSLRWLRQLRLGKPHRSEGCLAVARRAKAGLGTNQFSVIASAAKQSMCALQNGLLRRFAPRNDGMMTGRAFANKRR
jgi:hypothetical protein